MIPNLIGYRLQRARSLTAVGALLAGLALGNAALVPARAADASEVKQEVGETLDAIKNYTAEKRDEAVSAGGKLIDRLDARIEALERKTEEASDSVSAATKAKWEETRHGLISMRAQAASKLDSMRESSGETWNEAKDGFSDAVERLGEAIEEAGEDLQS